MNEPVRENNEFEVAEITIRRIGSNLWFGGLSPEWQEFLVANTVEFFDNHEVSMLQAAQEVIRVYQILGNRDPSILNANPWEANIKLS